MDWKRKEKYYDGTENWRKVNDIGLNKKQVYTDIIDCTIFTVYMHYATNSLADPEDQNLKNILSK
jgi:hypothetical protein